MTKEPELHQEINLTIQRLGINGEGVGSLSGFTVFVDGALPGEKIQAKMIERKKNYGRAKIIKIENLSSQRQKPICPFFGTCGGCQVMHLKYAAQLEMKTERVNDALKRIGKLKDIDALPCIASPNELYYRNKIQLAAEKIDKKPCLGFYSKGSHDVIDIDGCYIHCKLGEKIFSKIRKMILDSQVSIFDWKTLRGELRHILIKTSENSNESLLIFITNEPCSKELRALGEKIFNDMEEIKGVLVNINSDPNNVVLSDKYQQLFGEGHIKEKILDMTFKVSPASFFQINPKQAEHLYQKVNKFADFLPSDTLLDTYCGVGTLSLLAAKNVKKVIGIECSHQAILDANQNAEENAITNAQFIEGFAENVIQKLSNIDVLFLNPPRKGCAKQLLDSIKRLKPRTIVYISCDPATLARDLNIIRNFNYKIETVQPLDMFPQTAHVETVVKLERENSTNQRIWLIPLLKKFWD